MKYSEVKKDLKILFENAKIELPNNIHDFGDYVFVIYRGFKITLYRETNYIEIVNVRSSDFYKFISDNLLKYFIQNGFEKSCDTLQIKRDYRRVVLLSKRIRNSIVKNEISKWEELKRERRMKVKRIITLKRKNYA